MSFAENSFSQDQFLQYLLLLEFQRRRLHAIYGTRQRFIMIRLCADAKCDPSALATDLTHEMQHEFGHKIDQNIARKLVCLSCGLKVKDSAQNIFNRAQQDYHWLTSQPEFCLLTARPKILPSSRGVKPSPQFCSS